MHGYGVRRPSESTGGTVERYLKMEEWLADGNFDRETDDLGILGAIFGSVGLLVGWWWLLGISQQSGSFQPVSARLVPVINSALKSHGGRKRAECRSVRPSRDLEDPGCPPRSVPLPLWS